MRIENKYLLLAAMFVVAGCMVRMKEPPVEVDAYYVENPLEGDYRPSRMLMFPDVSVVAAWSVNEQATAFFVSPDGGLNWTRTAIFKNWMCEVLKNEGDLIYCGGYDTRREGATVECGKVLCSNDFGVTWNDYAVFDGVVENAQMYGPSAMVVQMYSVTKDEETDALKSKGVRLITNDDGKTWTSLEGTDGCNEVSLSGSDVLAVYWKGAGAIVKVDPKEGTVDTVRNMPVVTQLIQGEDIIGAWNHKCADYFRLSGDSASFVSRIRYKNALVDHIPERIYQHGDVVYTMVLTPGFDEAARMFVSVDRAVTWHPLTTKTSIDTQFDTVYTPTGDAWFMAGYKDRMVSYCVGYKDGRRRDFIKVIRPQVANE